MSMHFKNTEIEVGVRLMSGFVIGFEILPLNGVYLDIALGIFNIVIYNPEELED